MLVPDCESWLAAGVLAFNLGIEAVQLLLVALVAPVLVLAGRWSYYGPVRRVCGLLGGVTAVVDRASGAVGEMRRDLLGKSNVLRQRQEGFSQLSDYQLGPGAYKKSGIFSNYDVALGPA